MRHATWRTLSPEIDDELKILARRQFMAEASRFRGHPAEMVLTFYATRTVRGISLTPHAVLGADVATVTPVHGPRRRRRAAWRPDPLEKFHARIYRALFAKVNATVCGLPSTHDELPAPAISRGRRGLSAAAVRGYEQVLAGGPLEARAQRRGPRPSRPGTLGQGLADPTLHRGVLAVSLFHLWHERYRDRLAGDDPLDELA